MSKKIYSIILALSLLIANFAFAEGQTISSNKADIARVEQYLNNIKTFVSPFTQVDASGAKSDGTFYLSRPGKLRWEYNPPTPVLIIAKGSLLTYYDSELDQVSHVGLEDSLSGFLTREVISFSDKDIDVLKVARSNNNISITIKQKQKAGEGELTLIFDQAKPELKQMVIVDSIGKTTTVNFETIVYDKQLGKELFVLPKIKRNRR
ncbi:MAG: lipoprotein chaperone [Rickettsiaceae bacterium]|jgi:outer membrane lipoprotein-sorting protein|nr:lipoprotein chaperone [Rickettsiaceae bacterium]